MAEVMVTAKGPMFDGSAELDVALFLDEAIDLVAAYAEEQVDHNLAASIRNPSSPPKYQATIRNDPDGLDRKIWDGDTLLYGAWLEGVGSRNATTRFKGYFSFRKARQKTEEMVPVLVTPAMNTFMERVS